MLNTFNSGHETIRVWSIKKEEKKANDLCIPRHILIHIMIETIAGRKNSLNNSALRCCAEFLLHHRSIFLAISNMENSIFADQQNRLIYKRESTSAREPRWRCGDEFFVDEFLLK